MVDVATLNRTGCDEFTPVAHAIDPRVPVVTVVLGEAENPPTDGVKRLPVADFIAR
jgi:hypothetical protein